MSTFADSVRAVDRRFLAVTGGLALLLAIGAVSAPYMLRPRMASHEAIAVARQRASSEITAFYAHPAKAKPIVPTAGMAQTIATEPAVSSPVLNAAAGRKMIRTGSLELVVQHPAETADQIAALAENLGGYLVSADGGGQNASIGTLTVRVPAARFEQARAAIRKFGLLVESEKIDAQDVTQQYVDQDASIRNLKAEEAQYLTILKQAGTVKEMLAVTAQLSEVRGQIEQQQAEFNALSQQIETVALTISLRTESEERVLGLDWRPGYQLKLALRDGLESVANYATAMAAILFYLPAVLLWVGTIFFSGLAGWRMIRWAGRKWFHWKESTATVQ